MNRSDNPLAVQELNHVALHVRDLEASVRFYRDVLGLPSLPRPDFGFGGAWFALGRQGLHLIDDPAPPNARYSFHFALRVVDVYASSVALRERGFTDFQGPATRPDGAVQVFFRDPDAHVIEQVSFPVA